MAVVFQTYYFRTSAFDVSTIAFENCQTQNDIQMKTFDTDSCYAE